MVLKEKKMIYFSPWEDFGVLQGQLEIKQYANEWKML